MSEQRYNIYTPRQRTQIAFAAQGKTQQHFKAQVNINNIVRRYTQTGVVDHLATRPVKYGYASALDFGQVMRNMAALRSDFEHLPDHVREHFDNSAAAFIDAMADENRQAELREVFGETPIPEAGVPADRASEGTTGGPGSPVGDPKSP